MLFCGDVSALYTLPLYFTVLKHFIVRTAIGLSSEAFILLSNNICVICIVYFVIHAETHDKHSFLIFPAAGRATAQTVSWASFASISLSCAMMRLSASALLCG